MRKKQIFQNNCLKIIKGRKENIDNIKRNFIMNHRQRLIFQTFGKRKEFDFLFRKNTSNLNNSSDSDNKKSFDKGEHSDKPVKLNSGENNKGVNSLNKNISSPQLKVYLKHSNNKQISKKINIKNTNKSSSNNLCENKINNNCRNIKNYGNFTEKKEYNSKDKNNKYCRLIKKNNYPLYISETSGPSLVNYYQRINIDSLLVKKIEMINNDKKTIKIKKKSEEDYYGENSKNAIISNYFRVEKYYRSTPDPNKIWNRVPLHYLKSLRSYLFEDRTKVPQKQDNKINKKLSKSSFSFNNIFRGSNKEFKEENSSNKTSEGDLGEKMEDYDSNNVKVITKLTDDKFKRHYSSFIIRRRKKEDKEDYHFIMKTPFYNSNYDVSAKKKKINNYLNLGNENQKNFDPLQNKEIIKKIRNLIINPNINQMKNDYLIMQNKIPKKCNSSISYEKMRELSKKGYDKLKLSKYIKIKKKINHNINHVSEIKNKLDDLLEKNKKKFQEHKDELEIENH